MKLFILGFLTAYTCNYLIVLGYSFHLYSDEYLEDILAGPVYFIDGLIRRIYRKIKKSIDKKHKA